MTTRIVEWSSADKLACSACLPADVYLCIRPELLPLLSPVIVNNGGNFPYNAVYMATNAIMMQFPLDQQMHSILATVTAVATNTCDCSTPIRYTLEYDDSQLIEGTELIASDITGAVCSSCLINVVKDIIWQLMYSDYFEAIP